jgi:hypothetical protein
VQYRQIPLERKYSGAEEERGSVPMDEREALRGGEVLKSVAQRNADCQHDCEHPERTERRQPSVQ